MFVYRWTVMNIFRNLFLGTFKLLWYAHVYDKSEVNNLKHVMNEVVTIFNVMLEIYLVYNLLARQESTKQSELWLWDQTKMKWQDRHKKSCHITRVYELMTSLTGIDALYSINFVVYVIFV